jgi:integrase
MGTIRELSKKDGTKSYHAEVRVRGATHQRASFRTRTLAKKWVQDTESAIRDGRHFRTSEAKKHTVEEFIDRFIEQWIPKYPMKYQSKQKALLLWWKDQKGHLLLADLTASQIAECRDRLIGDITYRKTKRSGSTANRYLAALSKALSIAVKEWGWLEENPMRKISRCSESQGRARFLSKEEVKRLLQACQSSSNPFLLPLVRLALATGMRYSEMVGKLCWKDIDFSQRTITLEHTKNGERAVIPMTNEMEDILKSSPTFGSPPSELVFKAIYKRREATVLTVRYAFQKALKEAGIEGVVFHDLRRTFCSHAAMQGATQPELQRLMRHLSPKMTSVYARFSQKHLSNLMERVHQELNSENENE